MPTHKPATDAREHLDEQHDGERAQETDRREMPCPVCGTPMPDLKGGKATICPVCGFKDSCCY